MATLTGAECPLGRCNPLCERLLLLIQNACEAAGPVGFTLQVPVNCPALAALQARQSQEAGQEEVDVIGPHKCFRPTRRQVAAGLRLVA